MTSSRTVAAERRTPPPRTGRIRVVVRKRPLCDSEADKQDCVAVELSSWVDVHVPKRRVDLSEYTDTNSFEFDNCFCETDSTEAVFLSFGKSLIDTVIEGGSASCFAYGQTGSGKTHTMIGTEHEPGICVLAARTLFQRLDPKHHRVAVSFYEIYNNSLFDLLNHRNRVCSRETANKRVTICGVTEHEVQSPDDLVDILTRGTAQRCTGSTSANAFSSRSHAVMSILLYRLDHDVGVPFPPSNGRQPLRPCGSLNMVDLAGSERAADTQRSNDHRTRLEGAEINKSLLALKECIRALDERRQHIPFRRSKLTRVLRDSFVGHSRTVMVATVAPSAECAEQTLNTLRYAFRVKGLSVAQLHPSSERKVPRSAPPGPSNHLNRSSNRSLTPNPRYHQPPPRVPPATYHHNNSSPIVQSLMAENSALRGRIFQLERKIHEMKYEYPPRKKPRVEHPMK